VEGTFLDLCPTKDEVLLSDLHDVDLAALLGIVVCESDFRVYRLSLATFGIADGNLQIFATQIWLGAELSHDVGRAEAHIEVEKAARVLENDKDPVSFDEDIDDGHGQIELDGANNLFLLVIPYA
jgi:hypothetical protein